MQVKCSPDTDQAFTINLISQYFPHFTRISAFTRLYYPPLASSRKLHNKWDTTVWSQKWKLQPKTGFGIRKTKKNQFWRKATVFHNLMLKQ